MPPASEIDRALDADDLRIFGDATLGYLRHLSSEEIENRLSNISLDAVTSESDLEQARDILRREGIVIVRNFLSDEAIELGETAASHVKDALIQASSGANIENDNILMQDAASNLSGYAALAAHPKTVISVRQGADAGMVDVFNVDRLLGAEQEILREPFQKKWLLELIAGRNAHLNAENLNLYLNRGIQKTRGFHADSYTTSLKGFVYLSDVTELGDGPYCFVRQSHVDGPWRKVNQQISKLAIAKTEAPFVDPSMIVPIIAPRGSFILSDQAGFHRGIPQSSTAERRVLVMRYKS